MSKLVGHGDCAVLADAATDSGWFNSAANRPEAFIPYTLIAYVNQRNELLMVKRNKPPFVGCWNFIGGKIAAGETPVMSATRELQEEANRSASESSLKFRGIALWPDQSNSGQYLGMFMFRIRDRVPESKTRQLGMLHEGVTAWIDVGSLASGSGYKAVPNFELIATAMLDTHSHPIILCHEVAGDSATILWTHSIRTRHYPLVSSPNGTGKFQISDIIDIA